MSSAPTAVLQNNLVYNNNQFGIRLVASNNVIVENNTIANNGNEAKAPPLQGIYEPAQLYVQSGTGTVVENNILFSKSGSYVFTLKTESGITVTSNYNTYFKNGNTYLVNYNGNVYTTLAAWSGSGAGANDLDGDPLFVNAAGNDYHIKSTWGSYPFPAEWPPVAAPNVWVLDATNSPALDAGNPADAFANEPQSGNRINQGAYGNTAQASKSVVSDLYWDGSTSTDWQDVTNWTPEQIPTALDNVIIPDLSAASNRYPIVDDGATTAVCNNLTIEAFTSGNTPSVTIATNGQMTVGGTITNANGVNGIIVKSDATGDGSFIQNNAALSATVERYLLKTIGEAGQWHFLGSPITTAPVSMFNTNNFYQYNEVADDWWTGPTYYYNSPSGWQMPVGNLSVSKGYIYYFYQTTLNFKGTLNYDAVGYVTSAGYTTHAGNAANGVAYTNYDGWCLVSNPFTSALDWESMNLSNINNTVYFYDDATNNYKYYNVAGPTYAGGITINGGSQYIPMAQGFFIKTVNAAGGTFTIPAASRVHNDQAFWKAPENLPGLVRLKIEHGGYSDETVVRLMDAAEKSFDGDFDAYKRFSWSDDVPQIYTVHTDGTEFAINSLHLTEDIYGIPLAYKVSVPGTYTLQATELSVENTFVALHDVEQNTLVEIVSGQNYTFEAGQAGIDDRHLELVFERNIAPVREFEIADQEVFKAAYYEFAVPVELFSDANRFDVLTMSVTSGDGSGLPTWLTYNAQTRTLSGIAPNTEQTVQIRVAAKDRFGLTASDVYLLTVRTPVTQAEVSDNKLVVFPVPAKNELFITLSGKPTTFVAELRSVTGQEVYRNSFDNVHTNVLKLNGLSKGIYMLTIRFEDNSTLIRKIVVE